MAINDTLKQKVDELDLDAKLGHYAAQAERGLRSAFAKAATFADARQDDVGSWLDKAQDAINERTEGKYAEQVGKAKGFVSDGVSKLAEHASAGDSPDASADDSAATADEGPAQDPSS